MPRTALLTLALLLAPSLATAQSVEAQGSRDEFDYAVDSTGVLYRINLDSGEYAKVGQIGVTTESGRKLTPAITDLAATPDGHLYAISFDGLYLVNISDPGQSRRIGALGISGANAMTLAPDGRILVTTLAGQVHAVDLETGRATLIGPMGGGLASSGDSELVGDYFYATTKDAKDTERLARVDHKTGHAEDLGELRDVDGRPVRDVWGLINRKGRLYGLTASGDIVRIDVTNPGRCVRVLRTRVTWWGATAYVRM